MMQDDKMTPFSSHPRPQPPAVPRVCGGGHPLPDGGGAGGHGVTAGVAREPGCGAHLPGHGGGAGRRHGPQPGHHRHVQHPPLLEAPSEGPLQGGGDAWRRPHPQ